MTPARRAADALGVGHADLERVVARAFAHGDQAGNAAAGDELAANQMARPLRRDQQRVDALGRLHVAEVDVESVRTHQHVAGLEVRLDFALEQVALQLVGDENVDHVGGLGGVGGAHRLEAVTDRQVVVLAAGALADDDVDARVAEVLGLSVALRAVADDGDGLAGQGIHVGVLVVINRSCHCVTL